MSRYRLCPTPAQEVTLREHCAHARYVWNLCVEQQSWWRQGRGPAPNWAMRSRQLTEARAEFYWLGSGSRVIQEQALRDFEQAMTNFYRGSHGKPTWRKAAQAEGFRAHNDLGCRVRRLSRRTGAVQVPKVGWVRFRWSRAVPESKSYRVTLDRAGRWHVAFAAIPLPITAPGNGEIVGVDRGIAISAALSTGEMLRCPGLRDAERNRLLRLQRKLARARRGSNRRVKAKLAIAKLKARESDRRKDWAEKVSTDLARRFDLIRVEDLNIADMTRSARGNADKPGRNVRQKSGLNRSILVSGWGLMVKRLEDKAPGRVEKINPAYTSQRCSACGHVDPKSRESQADFRCTACGFACNADVNAAMNIAAGHAVNARGGLALAGPVNREPRAA